MLITFVTIYANPKLIFNYSGNPSKNKLVHKLFRRNKFEQLTIINKNYPSNCLSILAKKVKKNFNHISDHFVKINMRRYFYFFNNPNESFVFFVVVENMIDIFE
jgi:hypothetical protein